MLQGVTSETRFVRLSPRQGRPMWAEKHPLNLNQVMLAEEVAIVPPLRLGMIVFSVRGGTNDRQRRSSSTTS